MKKQNKKKKKTKIKNVVGRQFIGQYENIINEIENIENSITNFYELNFYARPIQEAYMVEGYDVAIADEVNYWSTDTAWHYGNYYVLNENNEYVPASGEFIEEDVYYQKELFLYDYNDNLIWNK